MNCLEFKAQLERAVEERRLPPGDDFAAHRAACADCRRAWNDHQLLTQAIASWNRDHLDTDLADAIVARWLVETTGPVQFGSANETAAAPPAVVLAPASPAFASRGSERVRARRVMWIPAGLLALFFALVWRGGADQDLKSTSLDGSPQNVRPTADVPELETLIADVETGYRELAQSAVTSVSGAAELFPRRRTGTEGDRARWLPSMPRSPFADTNPAATTESESSGPVRQGLSQALDLILEVVPVTEAG